MLPKIEHPTFEIKLESLKKSIRFRPMLVKEEKLLLMAKETQQDADIFSSVKQVVINCCLDDKIKVDKIPLFELEYIFLVLRMQSINNVVELSYHDTEDDQDYKFSVNLEDIKIKYPENNISNNIKIGKSKSGLMLRYPPASLYSNEKFLKSKGLSDSFDEILLNSIEEFYDENNVYPVEQETRENIVEFLENLDTSTYRKIQEFFESTPSMEYVINYKNKNGTDRSINLRTLNDFFIL